MKITDYHRMVVTRYYGRLLRRHGLAALLRRIGQLRRIVWTAEGLSQVERRT